MRMISVEPDWKKEIDNRNRYKSAAWLISGTWKSVLWERNSKAIKSFSGDEVKYAKERIKTY